MVANREALAYLPAGADLDRLSYDQLGAWAEAMRRGTGRSKVGFPVAERGLMHRFIQGYLYPSFTGGMVTTFKSDEAVAMWQWMRAFWPSVDPLSLTYSNMSEPLINDEVWVGWDHSARMLPVFRARPDDFVAFPAPIGPKGRGFLVVVVGLGVPVGAEDAEGGAQLMSYLLQPSVQVATLQATGFFPVVGGGDRSGLPPALGNMARAIDLQAGSDGALPAFLPVGLKALSDEFNIRYSLAFSQIVLRDQDIREALERQGSGLASLLVEAGAPCWRPDPPSAGHCRLR
jgi:multiple sugar transport system substrate-binding protein